jgi:nifR3 family TIM-barrel protein
MAGVTDVVFRELCLSAGADFAFTEMVSAKGLSFANDKTRHLIDLSDAESCAGVQIFGHEPDVMAQQAAWIERELTSRLACIDINMGCPARKIVSKGDGSALMKSPDLAARIVKSVRAAVSCPVTVKFRRGWDEVETAPEFARVIEDAGAAAITVHGRFAMQLYHGRAQWETIARVKQAVSIPVIGNGDIKCAQDALCMLDQTGCDGVMIARAAEGNPWIFTQVKAALNGEGVTGAPTVFDRLDTAKLHACLLAYRTAGVEYNLQDALQVTHSANLNENVAGANISRMRKHAMWYMYGLQGAAYARGQLARCTTYSDFAYVFDELREKQLAVEAEVDRIEGENHAS